MSDVKRFNPNKAEIDLAALRHNYRTILAANPDGKGIIAVVKADGYGHGLLEIAQELEHLGTAAFAVAFLNEGIKLRQNGITCPILIMGGLFDGEETCCLEQNLSTALFTYHQAEALDKVAGKIGWKAKIHVKIDTGLSRIGISPGESRSFLERLKGLKNLELEGVYTQLASANSSDSLKAAFTDRQIELFREFWLESERQGFSPDFIHCANSAAALSRRLPFCNMVRTGLALYGATPFDEPQNIDLRPVMSLKSSIALVKWVDAGTNVSYGLRFSTNRRTLVSSIPIGYGDGYPYSRSGRSRILVRGEYADVIGTPCMDWIMADVTDIPGVAPGDEVTLFGYDGAGGCLRPEELATWNDTIPNQLFCGITDRIPKMYLNSACPAGIDSQLQDVNFNAKWNKER